MRDYLWGVILGLFILVGSYCGIRDVVDASNGQVKVSQDAKEREVLNGLLTENGRNLSSEEVHDKLLKHRFGPAHAVCVWDTDVDGLTVEDRCPEPDSKLKNSSYPRCSDDEQIGTTGPKGIMFICKNGEWWAELPNSTTFLNAHTDSQAVQGAR